MDVYRLSQQEKNQLQSRTPRLRKEKKIDRINRMHQTYTRIKKQLEMHKKDGQIQKEKLKEIKHQHSKLTQLAFDQIKKCHLISFQALKNQETQQNPQKQNRQCINNDIQLIVVEKDKLKKRKEKNQIQNYQNKQQLQHQISLIKKEDKILNQRVASQKIQQKSRIWFFQILLIFCLAFLFLFYSKGSFVSATRIKNF